MLTLSKITIAFAACAAFLGHLGHFAVAQQTPDLLGEADKVQGFSQLDLSSENLDSLQAEQVGSRQVNLFKADEQIQESYLEQRQAKAQQNLVLGTLQLTGAVVVGGLVLLGIYFYSTRKDPLGFSNRANF